MNKWGWKNVTERYYAATGLVHDSNAFGNRVRQLKALWGFIQKLRFQFTGLGRREDGSVIATDEWWRLKTKGRPEWKKLKDGWPEYLPELDRMFQGVAVDGASAYAPGQHASPEYISSEEDDDNPDEQTPQSIGSKRSSSSRSTNSTATSPNKRTRNPTARQMDNNMRNLNVILENKNEVIANIWAERQKSVRDRLAEAREKEEALERKIDEVLDKARAAGADEKDATRWIGVLQITQSERAMAVFLRSAPQGRLAIIDYYAGGAGPPYDEAVVDVPDDDEDEQWEEDFFDMLLDDDAEETAIIFGTWWCREVLLGGLWVPESSGLPCSLQGDEVPSTRLSKRRRTTR